MKPARPDRNHPAGVHPDVADAEADYQLVKDLHTEAGLIDGHDAAVVERRDDGKVRITRKHETRPARSAAEDGMVGNPRLGGRSSG